MPVDDWLVQLDNLAARSAGFFLRKPIVLDLTNLDIGQDELRDLVAKLATRKVRIMGIEGAKASLLAPDLPPALTDGKGTSDVEIPSVEESSAPVAAANLALTVSAPSRANSSVVVSQPVRSGQSLQHAEGDVTIVWLRGGRGRLYPHLWGLKGPRHGGDYGQFHGTNLLQEVGGGANRD